MQFTPVRRDIQPFATGMSPSDSTVGYYNVTFSYQPVDMISKIRNGFKGLFKKSHKPSFTLSRYVIMLNIVVAHDVIQSAQVMIDKNVINQFIHDVFITVGQMQISPLISGLYRNQKGFSQ
jgi:hypothetical protein